MQSGSVTWTTFKVFTKSFDDARQAVFLINSSLRELHLNLQGSKTEILSGSKLEHELFYAALVEVTALIDKAADRKKISTGKDRTTLAREASRLTRRFTRKLPESVMSLSGRDNRLLRRLFTLFSLISKAQLRFAAIAALRQIPDVRMLRSTLSYLVKLDYRYHDEIVDELIDVVQSGQLPFSYQRAAVIEGLARMAPSDPLKLASHVRRLGLVGKQNWYVRQKAVEGILHLPYNQNSAETIARAALSDENPWVRRAGAALVLRGGRSWIAETIRRDLIYHADHELARVGLYWQQHLADPILADREIAHLFKSGTLDVTFHRRLKMIYLLRCSDSERVLMRLSEYLNQFIKTKNAVVRWHCEHIQSELARL